MRGPSRTTPANLNPTQPQLALASLDDSEAMQPKDVLLDKAHWRDPNRGTGHWSIQNLATNAVAFRFATLKALQAPLEDIDRAFLSQFISLMRRDGLKVRCMWGEGAGRGAH